MRVLHYSHDAYGLGHIRRTLAIAEQISFDYPHATQLLVSGTPQPHCFSFPRKMDFIKIPTLGGIAEEFHSPSLLLPGDALKTLRKKIILEAVKHFSPDVVLVDQDPAGSQGELLPALHFLKNSQSETKIVLGMSDIADHAMIARKRNRSESLSGTEEKNVPAQADEPIVRDLWRRQGIHVIMENLYDSILHYGSREIYDPIDEYRLSRSVESKLTSCGYIGRTSPARESEKIRQGLKMKTNRLIVVTAGGGEEGFGLLKSYIEMLSEYRDQDKISFDSLIIPGPLMSSEKRKVLQSYQALGLPFTFLDSTSDMFSFLNAADLIVSTGGYNTLCESVSLGKQIIVVPHVKPRVEQLVRAGRFANQGLVQMIHPEKLSSGHLLSTIHNGLNQGRPMSCQEVGLDMNGAKNASRAIGGLFVKRTDAPHSSAPYHFYNEVARNC